MTLEETRASLLVELDAADTPTKFLSLQLRLTHEIRKAEVDKKNEEMGEHKHKIRLMGDALAWKLLDRHTIRELSRDRLRPAHLSSQGADFDFVLDVAEECANAGGFPILCDLTHLLAVGDVISVHAGGIHILECKNRAAPLRPPTGRQARQEKRARHATQYLSTGFVEVEEVDNSLSLDVNEPAHEYELMRNCVDKCYRDPSGGAALERFGTRDFLLAMRPGQKKIEDLLGPISGDLDSQGWHLPRSQGFTDAIWHPSPFYSNPYALPLSVQQRCDLADAELILMRFVDVANLSHTCEVDGSTVEVGVTEERGLDLWASVDGEKMKLSGRFIDQIFWDFKSSSKMRNMLAESAVKLSRAVRDMREGGGGESQHASPAVSATSAFVFRSHDKDAPPVARVSVEQLVRLGYDISQMTDDLFVPVEGAGDMEVSPPLIVDFSGSRPTIRLAPVAVEHGSKAAGSVGVGHPREADAGEEGSSESGASS